MRAVVQRVNQAFVEVDGEVVGRINKGLVLFLGVGQDDTEKDSDYLAGKISGLRIFEDAEGLMNLSVRDVSGEILSISQFTLYGDCRKGRRPGFSDAAPPDKAEALYDSLCEKLRELGIIVEKGVFQAQMRINVDNDGPVTILLDSKKFF